ncbi:fungal-specific transcription factor domain-containing protein [Lentinula edodes]|nr:fungal-specific transcription factor domain-containing protein [Lentinula edodes]
MMLDEDSEPRTERKKPRLPNACRNCRAKKVKGDSAIRPGNICSNCIAFGSECTHGIVKKRGPRIGLPHGKRSVQATVDAILSTRRSFEVPKDPVITKEILVNLANYIKDLEEDIAQLRQGLGTSSTHREPPPSSALQLNEKGGITRSSLVPDNPFQSPDDYSIDDLTRSFKMFGEFDDNCVRHFGSSSSRALVKDALDMKKEYTGDADFVNAKPSFKRVEFWSVHPWQIRKPEDRPPPFEFPPDDLMISLIDLFFTKIHLLLPILHRPSFLKSVAKGLHHEDRHFGGLVLAICALGARFSDDPRVFEEHTSNERSIGWKWIRQIEPIKGSFTDPPTIHEIQLYTVYVMFVGPTSTPEACWILISIGVRSLQDVGAHRKLPNHVKPSVETESWKRAFWFMYVTDIFASTLLGRPRSMSQNDFDADLPIDCDDEYWEQGDPELAFEQPPGKPSTMSYWTCYLKLTNILGLTLHTIHGVRQSDIWSATMGLSKKDWNERIVTEVDSLLNKWIDEIPDHLKWDPDRENIEHFDQSVMLYTTYYWTQILVHRPFIHRPGEDTHSNIPSLAICANAARSCLRVVEAHQQRKTNAFIMPNVMMALFNSVIVLLVNMWRGKHFIGSSSSDFSKELADVHRAINTFHLHENRWEQAGRLADILMEVISVSHFHQSSQPRTISLKRPRIENNILPSSLATSEAVDNEDLYTTGRNGLSVAANIGNPPTASIQELAAKFALPLNSNELGSLPICEPFDWSTPQNQWGSTSANQTADDSWAATIPYNASQFGFYSTSSGTFTDFSGEGQEVFRSVFVTLTIPS